MPSLSSSWATASPAASFSSMVGPRPALSPPPARIMANPAPHHWLRQMGLQLPRMANGRSPWTSGSNEPRGPSRSRMWFTPSLGWTSSQPMGSASTLRPADCSTAPPGRVRASCRLSTRRSAPTPRCQSMTAGGPSSGTTPRWWSRPSAPRQCPTGCGTTSPRPGLRSTHRHGAFPRTSSLLPRRNSQSWRRPGSSGGLPAHGLPPYTWSGRATGLGVHAATSAASTLPPPPTATRFPTSRTSMDTWKVAPSSLRSTW